MSVVADPLAALEARVAALEAELAPDILQSNVLTVDSTGKIGAQFTGTVNALGVDIPGAVPVSAAGSTNRVQWHDPSTQAILAELVAGWSAGGGAYAALAAAAEDANGAELDLYSSDVNKVIHGRLRLTESGVILALCGALTRQLLDPNGASDWLQLATTGRLAADLGTGVLNFAASPNSAVTTINHALGRAPAQVLLTAFGAPAFGEIPILNWASPTATQFLVSGQTTASWTGGVSFSWLALG